MLQVDVGIVALLGLLAAIVTGNLDRHAVRELDWDYLIFYGVALSLAPLGTSLGLNRVVGEAVGTRLADLGASPLVLVLGVAAAAILIRLVLGPEQAVLLLSLALVPFAAHLGFGYLAVLGLGLAVSVPYWHLLGLL